MDKDFIGVLSFAAGLIIGLFLEGWVQETNIATGVKARAAVEVCERDLPRSQKCEVWARPTAR